MAKDRENPLPRLVRLCREGNKEAWMELIDRITPLIFSICRKMRLSREDSLDIFGQVSYLLLKNLDNLKSASKILSYVATITRREIYASSRKESIYGSLEELSHSKAKDSQETPDKIREKSERSELLLESMAELPDRDYKLLQALFFDEDNPSYEKIGKKLGVPASSIGPLRQRALNKLYKILKRKRFIL